MEFRYEWEWTLRSNPDALWPLVSDTDRFNRDVGLPPIVCRVSQGKKKCRISLLGIVSEWEEEPFEWVSPERFGVERRYTKGPMRRLRVLVRLSALPNRGTRLVYRLEVEPRGLLGMIAIPLGIRLVTKRKFAAAFRRDNAAASGAAPLRPRVRLSAAAPELFRRLAAEAPGRLAQRLSSELERAADADLAAMRPYRFADQWREPRPEVLKLFLLAAKQGILDLTWNVLCPLCRSPESPARHLSDLRAGMHCESCRIDYTANFEQLVEVVFRPNAQIRAIRREQFCFGSPALTPHIVSQIRLGRSGQSTITGPAAPGRYRMRLANLPGARLLRVTGSGPRALTVRLSPPAWPAKEAELAPGGAFEAVNESATEQLFILERMAWSDQAATAAEVIALQTFRDLFSSEALRPGEKIEVGMLAVVFMDVRGSTQIFREAGDAAAFGLMRGYLTLLREIAEAHGGSVVKEMGDAVMAVFRSPVAAIEAALEAQRRAAAGECGRPLEIKSGLEFGRCICVTLSDRLDYFGNAVNLASRLSKLAEAGLFTVASLASEPAVRDFFAGQNGFRSSRFRAALPGFGPQEFDLIRLLPEPA